MIIHFKRKFAGANKRFISKSVLINTLKIYIRNICRENKRKREIIKQNLTVRPSYWEIVNTKDHTFKENFDYRYSDCIVNAIY